MSIESTPSVLFPSLHSYVFDRKCLGSGGAPMALVPYTAGPSGSGGAEASGRRPSFLDMEFPRLLRRSLSRLIWSSGLQKSLSSFSSLFSPPPGYRCRVCRAVFHDLFSFESHLIYAHADEPAYLCKLCGDTFAVKRDLAVHLLRDHVDANR